jgi:hypothetical protein
MPVTRSADADEGNIRLLDCLLARGGGTQAPCGNHRADQGVEAGLDDLYEQVTRLHIPSLSVGSVLAVGLGAGFALWMATGAPPLT